MGTAYSSQTASGYNASPPSDDGTVSASNQVFWGVDVKGKIGDPLKALADAINTALVAFTNFGSSAVSGTYATVAGDHMTDLECSGTFTVSLQDANTSTSNYIVGIKNVGSGTITVALVTNTDTLDGTVNGTTTLGPNAYTRFRVNNAANGYYSGGASPSLPAGSLMDFAGTSAPTGWLLCDGSAVSRTTYSALFSAISTTWGSGDGSTTFNVPDFRGRATIGSGTGTAAEVFTDSAVDLTANTIAVGSNTDKFITGDAWVFTIQSGSITPLVNSTTYYVLRADATHIYLCTTLANAQNGIGIDLTAKGVGSFTLTKTLTARSVGVEGGSETHAMSSTELLAHTHGVGQNSTIVGGAGSSALVATASNVLSTSTGGNTAMSIMPPYAVVLKIIKT